jgi:hypothetical protein
MPSDKLIKLREKASKEIDLLLKMESIRNLFFNHTGIEFKHVDYLHREIDKIYKYCINAELIYE